jgi:hypothetical protein
MKVTGIIGSSYLCSKFINHDGTVVTDHPIYVFDTDVKDLQLAVMFASKTNPFTTYYPDNKPLGFYGCSTYRGEVPNLRVFQAEVYCFKATDAKLSEYQFKYSVYNSELLKALRNALKFNSIKSVHDISNKENRPDQEEILKELTLFVNDWLTAQKSYPARGIVNCSYDDMKKYSNKAYTENTNKKVWRKS